jgi:hypothetical protein
MVGIGLGVFFAGYSLLVYGWSQLQHCNASLVSIVWPGSYKGCNPDPPAYPPVGKPAVGGSNPTGPIGQSPAPTNPLQAPPKGATGPARDYNPNQAGRQGQA